MDNTVFKSGYTKALNMFKIVDKNSQYVDFKLNPIQEKFLTQDATQNKLVILKARQQGFSSLILALFTIDFIFKKNVRNVVVADIQENAEDLLDRVKMYIESFTEASGISVPMKYNSRTELYNELTKSRYSVGTAQKTEFGRSKTINNLHLCVGENTKIISTNGITKKIKDIEIGDEVIAENGNKTIVTNKWDTGIKPIKRIRLWMSNETIDVSPEHKIRVASVGYNNKLSNPIWKKAKDLTTDDWVMWAYPKTGAYVKFLTIKKQKNCVHLKERDKMKIANQISSNRVVKTDYKLGYFLGYYLAEGHISKNLRRLKFTCHPDEYFYENFIDLFDIKPVIKVNVEKCGTKKTITYQSKELAMFINDLVGRVKNKHIPDKFLYQYPKKFLQGLYDGWKDGDGSKNEEIKRFTAITTIRESIARQMRQIFALLNHRMASLDYRKNTYRYGIKTQNSYVLREHGYNQTKKSGVRSLRGKKYRYLITRDMTPKNGSLFVKVKSIKNVDEQQTYEIEVKDKSHSFLTVCGVVSNSEGAFYPDMKRLMAGALQAVTPNGRVIIETTANGFNYFKEFWDQCEEGTRGFKPLFYRASDFYDKQFLEIKKQELGDVFKQEYPETPMEAFIVSGLTYFEQSALEYFLKTAESKIDNGEISENLFTYPDLINSFFKDEYE